MGIRKEDKTSLDDQSVDSLSSAGSLGFGCGHDNNGFSDNFSVSTGEATKNGRTSTQQAYLNKREKVKASDASTLAVGWGWNANQRAGSVVSLKYSR